MNGFTIGVANKPGEMARICDLLASHDVNIFVNTVAFGDHGTVSFVASDDTKARAALREAGIPFHESRCLVIAVKDEPGTAARAARKLAEAGVNIELFMPVGIGEGTATVLVGVAAADEDNARRALDEMLGAWTYG